MIYNTEELNMGYYSIAYSLYNWGKLMNRNYKLIRNIISRNKCGDIIESKFTHDYKECKCGAITIDGGLEYQKISGNDEDIDLSHSLFLDCETGEILTYNQTLIRKSCN